MKRHVILVNTGCVKKSHESLQIIQLYRTIINMFKKTTISMNCISVIDAVLLLM